MGLGKLTVEEILPAFGALQVFLPSGVGQWASGEGQTACRIYGVDPQAIYGYEDFERIRDNGRIDVVYIVLPNSHARRYTIPYCRLASTCSAKNRWLRRWPSAKR